MRRHVRASQYFLQIAKCNNEECSASARSSFKSVLPHGFFHQPLPVISSNSLQLSEGTGTFLSLFQRLSISISPDGYSNNKFLISYDLCYPTVSDFVNNRMCNICKLYFPSQVIVAAHKKKLHPRIKVTEVPKVSKVRIAARQQWELMAITVAGI